MSTTPGKPRQSGIPGPGRTSSIPTPGRSRSSSSVHQQHVASDDIEYMSRAFADAIRANDPAQHRPLQTVSISTTSLSPQSAAPQSGRRSVAGRSSSAASTSSLTGSTYTQDRPKTPTSARPPSRPPSRHSESFGRSTSRAFEVGDNVRIESLGYEGTLRYVGEIEGKQGLWAGVELSGGFSGKGKNNGTVNGKRYFSCPENCGVFVATVKLSPPTVGPGMVQRPPSVASGRITPAFSGRASPSWAVSSSKSNGRITPSNIGRVTPSLSSGRNTPGTTPAARARRPLAKSTNVTPSSSLTQKITAGSRASKYMSMTAKQLSSRDAGGSSPTPSSSANYSPQPPPSPSSSTGSPFSTPKPRPNSRASGIGVLSLTPNKGRLATPRARIPSAIAMPPPSSPISSRSASLNGGIPPAISLDVNKKIGYVLPPSGSTSPGDSIRPPSAASVRSTTADESTHLEQLQSRIDALEYDNERLRSLTSVPDDALENVTKLHALERERDDATSRVAMVEADLLASQHTIASQRTQIASLENDHQQAIAKLETNNYTRENNFLALQTKMNENLALIETLKSKLNEQEATVQDKENILEAKEIEITQLEQKLQTYLVELQAEKKELSSQIDELRIAGQETIALYEEQLSAAESRRYELENRVATLESSAHVTQSPSPPSIHTGISSATQIDNESLREQVLHLQRKISAMEDIMEDTRANSEKEESLLRERMQRLKEKEDGMKKELNEGRKDVERIFKSEAAARSRVEEVEEALRESTVALENARAEVEVLRTELANLDGLVADGTAGDLPSRVAEVAQRASTDRIRYEEEISKLHELLEESRTRERPVMEITNNRTHDEADSQHTIQSLEATVTLLQKKNKDLESDLTQLAQTLDERSDELESLKKKSTRDGTTNSVSHGALSQPPSSKYDISAAREEITGLKHIVQELQKENLAATHRIKLLESENELLLSEARQLRQEVQILEENLDQSVVHEDSPNVEGASSGSADLHDLQRLLKEQKARYETEQEQLRKRLAEVEMKNARTVHDLNKEISELEALVESKIYREDELEQELEKFKDKLARHKKTSKNSIESLDAHRHSTTSNSTEHSAVSRTDICEICERPGHDIFNCDLLKEEVPTSKQSSQPRMAVDLFCEDCESHGHVAADCPHSLDVF